MIRGIQNQMVHEGELVLVVDDDIEVRECIRFLLMDEGFRVESASNGREALDLMLNGLRPSVIVLDLMMPVMSGQEFLAQLAREPELRAIPVVVVSAASMNGLPVPESLLLPKPFSAEGLIQAVCSLATRRP
jgi:CheY-like chemotaxis protein